MAGRRDRPAMTDRKGASSDAASAWARDIFFNGLAHELRTPLTILKGRLHGLEDGVIDPESGECTRLLEQVDQLLRVVDDLGTLARVQTSEVMLDVRLSDLSQILQYTVCEVQARATTKSIVVNAQCGAIGVRCDPVRMVQALSALLRFMVDRGPSGQAISLSVNQTRDHVTIELASANFKLSEDCLTLPAAFPSDGHLPTVPGMSLGLAVGHALVGAHGWGLSIASESDQTKFLVRIPGEDIQR